MAIEQEVIDQAKRTDLVVLVQAKGIELKKNGKGYFGLCPFHADDWMRYFDSQMGRYLKDDPAGLSGGDINLFSYVANNPLMWIDPSGLAAFMVFHRCVNQGTMTIVDSDGKIYDFVAFDAGPGYERDIYGTNFQIPPSVYDVTPRPNSAGGKYPGYPTISDNANRNWNTLKSPKGTIRSGIQMHYGRNSKWSKGCIVSPDIDKIRALIDDEYNNGGVKLAVVDTCDKEPRRPPKPRKYRTINWKAYIKHKYGIEDVEICPGTE